MPSIATKDEAARWFMLHRSGDMTVADHSAFEAWIAATPAARAAYRQIERIWEVAGDGADEGDGAGGAGPIAANDAGPHRPAASSRRYGLVAGLAAIAAMLVVTAMPADLLPRLDPRHALASGGTLLSTGSTRRASQTLADGTVVTLDVDTRLRVLEMGERRRIELLAGHAFFRVAKDAAHPFLVTAMDRTVHAIGTAFDVRIAGDAVAVTLVEGKVRVDQSRGLLRDPIVAEMTPGQQLVTADDSGWTMAPVNTAQATSWLEDRLTYMPDTLAKVVADVNSGSPRKIVFLGPVDRDRPIIGVFRRGDVESVVTVLEMKDIAHVVSRTDDRIIMASGKAG